MDYNDFMIRIFFFMIADFLKYVGVIFFTIFYCNIQHSAIIYSKLSMICFNAYDLYIFTCLFSNSLFFVLIISINFDVGLVLWFPKAPNPVIKKWMWWWGGCSCFCSIWEGIFYDKILERIILYTLDFFLTDRLRSKRIIIFFINT